MLRGAEQRELHRLPRPEDPMLVVVVRLAPESEVRRMVLAAVAVRVVGRSRDDVVDVNLPPGPAAVNLAATRSPPDRSSPSGTPHVSLLSGPLAALRTPLVPSGRDRPATPPAES
jgi:hypothetical protein